MKRFLVPALAMLLVVTGLVTAANAATAEECQAKIDALVTQTASAEFFGRNAERDRAGLLDKLDQATAKLAEAKFADAIEKLTDFRTTVEEFIAGPKPKINPDDAAALIAGANDAVACIDSLLHEQ
jgi:uncharacterized iron-regulated protein